MKFHNVPFLALAFTPCASAFSFSVIDKVKAIKDFAMADKIELIRNGTKIEILEGVGLPTKTEFFPKGKRLTNFFQGSIKTNADVVKELAFPESVRATLQDLVVRPDKPEEKKDLGKVTGPRSDFFRKCFAVATNEVIKADPNDPDPAEGYLYFGNTDFKTILSKLCQCNPFFASALTMSEDKKFFELKAYSGGPGTGELKKEPLYLSLMREMTHPSHRINARFNRDMSLAEVTKYDVESDKMVVVPESEWDYYSSGVLYNMLYYSSAVHANIHILHYLMTCGIIMATRDTNKSMSKWADIYDDNIAIKHVEVAALLFPSTIAGKPFLNDNDKLVSGKDGFGATAKVMPKIKDMMLLWGSLQNEEEYTKKFLLEGIYESAGSVEEAEKAMEEGGILTEFKKHMANITPYADELTAAMREDDKKAFDETERKLKGFLGDCGEGVFEIGTVSAWTQLMCCTGITHGSTLSYTRLIIVPEVTRWRNITSDKWDEHDVKLMSGGFATASGMTLDRHTFTSSIQHGFKWHTENIAPNVKKVLDTYDAKALDLKIDYQEEIEKIDNFREYGWILTDHCKDGYDGKQHTITTYI